ncbi:hypothetical protein BX666DRAFT_2023661 [Dichotomocladium elegans]|nr:hypothetical protein BX666DRAFT_2023661 [Dichotomocladium elegans]
MQRTLLLLLLLVNTACQSAVIPSPDNDEFESLRSELQLEAAAFLDEDVFHHVNSPQVPHISDEQNNTPRPHMNDISNKNVYEDENYPLYEDRPNAQSSSLAAPVNTENPAKNANFHNTPILSEGSIFDYTPGSVSADTTDVVVDTFSDFVDDVYPEDDDDFGEDEFILDEGDESDEIEDEVEDIDEEDDDNELELDPESGMPIFKNMHEDDFNFDVLDITPDDEHSVSRTSSSLSDSTYRFTFSDWRLLLGLCLVLLILKIIAVQSGQSSASLTAVTTNYIERRKQLSHKYEQAAARRLPAQIQDMTRKYIREHPPPSFTFPTILEEEDEDEGIHTDKYNRRASAGHIRRPPASGSGHAPLLNHIRHASLSGKHPQ